jgi:hypothetical protein
MVRIIFRIVRFSPDQRRVAVPRRIVKAVPQRKCRSGMWPAKEIQQSVGQNCSAEKLSMVGEYNPT